MNTKKWLRRVPLQATDPYADRPVTAERSVEYLDDSGAMRLLAAAPYGRIVFVRDGEPEIRPMTHLVDAGEVIIRTRLNAALTSALAVDGGLRITYEADRLDVERRTGWSVIVSGTAAPVADQHRQARYKSLLQTMLAVTDDTVIAIRPKTVTGIRIVPGAAVRGGPTGEETVGRIDAPQ
jgi:nitroimidazol reductase NimA-like FMN-containing flavoprotein (pyridoxamine 5'-phosphate oxidase superfamily)